MWLMFGVFMYGWPLALNSSKRMSSIRITRKFGLRGTHIPLFLDCFCAGPNDTETHTKCLGFQYVLREHVRDVHVRAELTHEEFLHVFHGMQRDAADPRARELDQHLRHVEPT